MEFSGGPLDFTTLDLCVVKRPLIINITLQAHAGRFGIILLYIIVTTCCPSSAYFCQFNSLNPPALASNTKHYGPGHKAQLHPPKFPQLTFVTFIFYFYFYFFTLFRYRGEVKMPLPKQGGVGHELLTGASLCVVCFYGPSMVLERRSKKIGAHTRVK
jgi:hypothetical protein